MDILLKDLTEGEIKALQFIANSLWFDNDGDYKEPQPFPNPQATLKDRSALGMKLVKAMSEKHKNEDK